MLQDVSLHEVIHQRTHPKLGEGERFIIFERIVSIQDLVSSKIDLSCFANESLEQ